MNDDIRDATETPETAGPTRVRRRLKITSEGRLGGSKAIDLDTGETIPFREARISITHERGVEIELLVSGCVEIEGRGVVRAVCPACEQQRDMVVRVQKPDGTVAAFRPGMPDGVPIRGQGGSVTIDRPIFGRTPENKIPFRPDMTDHVIKRP